MSIEPATPQTTEANTMIWSEEHRAYWRPKAAGYTNDVMHAGVWSYAEAERMTRHCGPEKGIQLRLRHELPKGGVVAMSGSNDQTTNYDPSMRMRPPVMAWVPMDPEGRLDLRALYSSERVAWEAISDPGEQRKRMRAQGWKAVRVRVEVCHAE